MSQLPTTPLAGFDHPVDHSQQVFRAALDAFARPGRIVDMPGPLETPPPLTPASAALCLALADFETPVWLDGPARASDGVMTYLRFHCGCPIADDPGTAQFAVISDPADRPRLDAFRLGSDTYPETAATVIVQVSGLAAEGGVTLGGPGIERTHRLDVAGLDTEFWSERSALQELFPRGVDLIFADQARIAAIPRSTRVEI